MCVSLCNVGVCVSVRERTIREYRFPNDYIVIFLGSIAAWNTVFRSLQDIIQCSYNEILLLLS